MTQRMRRRLRAALAAPRLRFDMTWAVQNGRLKKRTVGGEPARTVRFILKTMGDRVAEPILELTQERLLLLVGKGSSRPRSCWPRLEWLETRQLPCTGSMGELVPTWTHADNHGRELANLVGQHQTRNSYSSDTKEVAGQSRAGHDASDGVPRS